MDDSPKNPMHATTTELLDAINALISNETLLLNRTKSIGCSVKWKV